MSLDPRSQIAEIQELFQDILIFWLDSSCTFMRYKHKLDYLSHVLSASHCIRLVICAQSRSN